jgi:hypothetical protein
LPPTFAEAGAVGAVDEVDPDDVDDVDDVDDEPPPHAVASRQTADNNMSPVKRFIDNLSFPWLGRSAPRPCSPV